MAKVLSTSELWRRKCGSRRAGSAVIQNTEVGVVRASLQAEWFEEVMMRW